jgi:hypothetical protein
VDGLRIRFVTMALAGCFGPDSILHPKCRAVGGGDYAGCCSDGLIAFPSPVSLLTLPQRLGQKGKKKFAVKFDGLSESCSARHTVNSPRTSSSSRRLHCAAKLEVVGTVEVGDDDLEHKSVFRPPLGWPFSAMGAPDYHFSGKMVKGTATLPDPAVILKEQDEEAGVSTVFDGSEESPSGNLYRHWIATEFSAAVQSGSPPPRQKQENCERDNYYVNIGYAIRTLREDLPNMFYKKLNFDIYRDDITFRDPMNACSGIDNYKLIFWALRFHGRIFFKTLWVDIGRVWQPHDKVIMVRWTVRGIPRVPWEAQGQFEGTSEYKLDKDGKIYEHKVDNIIFNQPLTQRNNALSVLDLVRVEGAQTTPTPSFYAQTATFFAILFPYLRQFTWVRFYWALSSTLALNNAGETCSEFSLNA